ncbi:hypothetical protein [Nocardia beijingensis]|uniref:hypothetical protein n=1 Tax=Nocardia beijingensis TaxID=95162 RepID=UPI0033B08E36
MSTLVKRTRMEWLRVLTRSYRRALLKADPDACAKIDAQARAAGQAWIVPDEVSAEEAEQEVNAVLSPVEISRRAGIPVGTIYSWASRGLIEPVEPGKYLVKDVLTVQARGRVSRLDIA